MGGEGINLHMSLESKKDCKPTMEEERKPQSKLQAGNCIFGLKRETNRILFHNPLENTKNGKHF